MKARIIQYRYGSEQANLGENFNWIISELGACDDSLDVIVLPEGCDAPAPSAAGGGAGDSRFDALMSAASGTARRCNAAVFVNSYAATPTGTRNRTFAFGPDGEIAGFYDKQNLTPSEHESLDDSYTREPSAPTVVEIGGVRYAFLTCYDFYFVEQWAALARVKPDVVIGCSLQRTDTHEALSFQNRTCAYTIGAYLLKASASMGAESPTGGCSCAIAPDGAVLGSFTNEVGHFDVEFDPHAKFLKKAGYVGNVVSTHPEYVERGRRPCKYRPGGSAIAPFFRELPEKRLCAHRGIHGAAVPENSLPSLAAAVALGATEIEFDLWPTADGIPVLLHDNTLERVSSGKGDIRGKTLAQLAEVDFGGKADPCMNGLGIVTFKTLMDKLACHVSMNIHIKGHGHPGGDWSEEALASIVREIDDHDARRHVYFMTTNGDLHRRLAALAPDIPRCMGFGKFDEPEFTEIVENAIKFDCQMVQLFKPYFDQSSIDRAKKAGIRINVFWSDAPEEARRFLDMGADTILTNSWLSLHNALGLN